MQLKNSTRSFEITENNDEGGMEDENIVSFKLVC